MIPLKLQVLLSEDFELRFFCADNNTTRFRLILLEDNSVIELREAIRIGEITWEQLEDFVNEIVKGYRPGFTLDGDVALCAIAVAIEEFESKFSGEFLTELSNSKSAELRKPRHMALKCLEIIRSRVE